jgi:histidine triad (HIT) family protein
MAPTHVLVVPRTHVASLAQASEVGDEVLAACLRACGKIAAQEGLDNGFRVVSNCGSDACQSVQHLHFHVLGGRKMSEGMA